MEAPSTTTYQQQLKALFSAEIKPRVAIAEAKIKANIIAKGLVLTADLERSIYSTARILEAGLVIEIELGMRGYGKLKDMRSLSTNGFDIDALEAFVLKTGLNKFDYIPGYYTDKASRNFKNRSKTSLRPPITDTRIARRIAWGIAISRKQKGIIKRKGKGFFNPVKGALEYSIAHSMAEATGQAVKLTVSELLEGFEFQL